MSKCQKPINFASMPNITPKPGLTIVHHFRMKKRYMQEATNPKEGKSIRTCEALDAGLHVWIEKPPIVDTS